MTHTIQLSLQFPLGGGISFEPSLEAEVIPHFISGHVGLIKNALGSYTKLSSLKGKVTILHPDHGPVELFKRGESPLEDEVIKIKAVLALYGEPSFVPSLASVLDEMTSDGRTITANLIENHFEIFLQALVKLRTDPAIYSMWFKTHKNELISLVPRDSLSCLFTNLCSSYIPDLCDELSSILSLSDIELLSEILTTGEAHFLEHLDYSKLILPFILHGPKKQPSTKLVLELINQLINLEHFEISWALLKAVNKQTQESLFHELAKLGDTATYLAFIQTLIFHEPCHVVLKEVLSIKDQGGQHYLDKAMSAMNLEFFEAAILQLKFDPRFESFIMQLLQEPDSDGHHLFSRFFYSHLDRASRFVESLGLRDLEKVYFLSPRSHDKKSALCSHDGDITAGFYIGLSSFYYNTPMPPELMKDWADEVCLFATETFNYFYHTFFRSLLQDGTFTRLLRPCEIVKLLPYIASIDLNQALILATDFICTDFTFDVLGYLNKTAPEVGSSFWEILIDEIADLKALSPALEMKFFELIQRVCPNTLFAERLMRHLTKVCQNDTDQFALIESNPHLSEKLKVCFKLIKKGNLVKFFPFIYQPYDRLGPIPMKLILQLKMRHDF